MITKVARKLFNMTLADKTGDADYSVDVRKAIAFAIFVKSHVSCSVLKNWSYRDLARLTGCSQATCKKRISALRALHLVRDEGRNLFFKNLKKEKIKNKRGGEYHTAKHSNVPLVNIDYSSCKSIERGLEGLVIVEDTRNKNYYRRLIELNQNPRPGDSLSAIKRARRVCRKKGLESGFVGGEFSYDGIARRIGCSKTKALKVVRYAESVNQIVKIKKDKIKVESIGKNLAKEAVKFFSVKNKNLFATDNNIYYQPCNTYTLPVNSLGFVGCQLL